VFVLAPSLAPAEPRVESFALVVANNKSLDPSLPQLQYADDDAARFYELMASTASQVEILAVLDEESQRVFPAIARATRAPRRAELREAIERLRKGILAARQRGSKTVLYFYFAGHGDVGPDREGQIHLLDGRFSRSDLYREVISRSPADLNHIIVDACNSYFLVNRRGGPAGRASVEQAIRSFLERESLERYPNTGVVLSTASMAETHEWSRYRSGIFSHQLLSALWGGADVNGDQRIDYRELAAYLAAANLRVRDTRARLSVFARPPRADAAAALLSLRALRRPEPGAKRPALGKVAAFLTVPKQLQGHHYLEDDRGVRYLDFNKSLEQPLRLALLDRPYYYLRSATQEAMLRPEGQSELDAGSLSFAPLSTRSRGSVEESFRRDLYTVPFGRSFVAGFWTGRSAPAEEPEALLLAATARPWYRRASTWKWVTAGTAAASLAVGIARDPAGSEDPTGDRRRRLRDRRHSRAHLGDPLPGRSRGRGAWRAGSPTSGRGDSPRRRGALAVGDVLSAAPRGSAPRRRCEEERRGSRRPRRGR